MNKLKWLNDVIQFADIDGGGKGDIASGKAAFAIFNDAGVFNNGGSSSISEWNTGSVFLMSEMFSNAALFNQDLKEWEIISVRDLQGEHPKGGKGADVLQGGSGKDELSGGGGKDMIYGGNNDDEISGNGGKDIFVLSRGKDIITDFKVGTDSLGLVYALDLKLRQKGDNLLIKTSDNVVHTKLLNVTRDEFLGDFSENNNYLQLPFVEVNVL